MECPSCHAELPSRECPECGEKAPVFGKFCCYCGATFPVPAATESEEGGVDFSSRTLCSDGNCIGVINKDGVCNECGKPFTGEAG
jgi:predicted amidophosphoribosyltransferase